MKEIKLYWIVLKLAVLLALLSVYLVLEFKIAPVSTAGFYCDDHSVNFTYKESTVHSVWLFLIILLPMLVVIVTELLRFVYVRFFKSASKSKSKNNSLKIEFPLNKILEVREQLASVFVNLVFFLFGLQANIILTLVGKLTTGRLRPNFLAVCKPESDPYATYCALANRTSDYLVPGVNFRCLSTDLKSIDESRKSFPSGHSSTSFYSMFFVIMYVQRVWTKPSLSLLAQFFQVAFFGLASFVAISRSFDHKHHPTDIIAGAFLGTAVALFVSHHIRLFYQRLCFVHKYDVVHMCGDVELNQSELDKNEP